MILKNNFKIFLVFFIIISGCSNPQIQKTQNTGKTVINDAFITQDTIWQNEIEINGTVTIMKSVTLTILPGSIIKFAPFRKKSNDPHEPTNGIITEGRLIAKGIHDQKIVFTSSSPNPNPGDWGKILIKYSKDNIFKYCKFEYSEFALHAHFSTGEITNCEFVNNIEGMRLGMSKFIIKNNTIINNVSRGINFRQSANIIEFNDITNNGTGIFLYEKNSRSRITKNNIYNNKNFNFQLGEFYSDDISLEENWWGVFDLKEIYNLIYDKNDNPNLGRVLIINPSDKKIENTGIQ